MIKKAIFLLFFCVTVFGVESESPFSRIPSISSLVKEYLCQREFKKRTLLCELMEQCGSPKGKQYGYATFYTKLFKEFKNEELSIFELGIGTRNLHIPSNMGGDGYIGASLFGWLHYFKNAQIYGADIDTETLFFTKRIHTYFCDQRITPQTEQLFYEGDLADVYFDIIIDDGLHDFIANLSFFLSTIGKLKKGGLYFIEGLSLNSVVRFREIFESLKTELSISYVDIIEIPISGIYLFIAQK